MPRPAGPMKSPQKKGGTMTISLGRLSPARRDWLKRYEEETGFEPMSLEDFKAGNTTWADLVRENLRWYELHTKDVYRRISSDVPD